MDMQVANLQDLYRESSTTAPQFAFCNKENGDMRDLLLCCYCGIVSKKEQGWTDGWRRRLRKGRGVTAMHEQEED